jgi:hypothetical protein
MSRGAPTIDSIIRVGVTPERRTIPLWNLPVRHQDAGQPGC